MAARSTASASRPLPDSRHEAPVEEHVEPEATVDVPQLVVLRRDDGHIRAASRQRLRKLMRVMTDAAATRRLVKDDLERASLQVIQFPRSSGGQSAAKESAEVPVSSIAEAA